MAHPMDLRELFEARDGLPTEDQAARKIATFAVIPAAIVGLLAGSRLVGLGDPIGRLLWVCTATALGAGFGVAFLVLGIYRIFGFRPMAVFADAMVGGLIGLPCGGALTMFLMWRNLAGGDHALWGLLTIPLGAIGVPVFRCWKEKKHGRRKVAWDSIPSGGGSDASQTESVAVKNDWRE